jgi:hypothetical protein
MQTGLKLRYSIFVILHEYGHYMTMVMMGLGGLVVSGVQSIHGQCYKDDTGTFVAQTDVNIFTEGYASAYAAIVGSAYTMGMAGVSGNIGVIFVPGWRQDPIELYSCSVTSAPNPLQPSTMQEDEGRFTAALWDLYDAPPSNPEPEKNKGDFMKGRQNFCDNNGALRLTPFQILIAPLNGHTYVHAGGYWPLLTAGMNAQTIREVNRIRCYNYDYAQGLVCDTTLVCF